MNILNKNINIWRGEVLCFIDGEPFTLRLTLGALARCEGALNMSLFQIVEALEKGTLTLTAMMTILALALEAGEGGAPPDPFKSSDLPKKIPPLEKTMIDGGVLEGYRLVSRLFQAAFYGGESPDASRPQNT
jgi:hypothetical protein